MLMLCPKFGLCIYVGRNCVTELFGYLGINLLKQAFNSIFCLRAFRNKNDVNIACGALLMKARAAK